MFEETIKSVLMGAAAGFTSAMIGYFRKTPVPQFSGKKFIKTLIIGIVVGGANPYYTEEVTYDFLLNLGYVTVIDRIADLVWTRIKAAIKE